MKNQRTIFKYLLPLMMAIVITQQAWAAFVGPRDDFRDESIYFVINSFSHSGYSIGSFSRLRN